MSETADGRAVVHPVHGAGRITDHVERGGREFVVFAPLAAPGGLTVLVPRERAGEHLREVGEADAALSSTEHRLLAEAEQLLAAELAAAQGKSIDEIEAWLAA